MSVLTKADFSCSQQNIKDIIVKSTELDTIHIFRTLGNTARVHKNKVAKEVVALERRPGGAKFEELAPLVSGARGKTVYETGDVDAGIWSLGISCGLITEVLSCKLRVFDHTAQRSSVYCQARHCSGRLSEKLKR